MNLLNTAYEYEVDGVAGVLVHRSKYFWHPMLHNGINTNSDHLLQPLFDHEGFNKLSMKLTDC